MKRLLSNATKLEFSRNNIAQNPIVDERNVSETIIIRRWILNSRLEKLFRFGFRFLPQIYKFLSINKMETSSRQKKRKKKIKHRASAVRPET